MFWIAGLMLTISLAAMAAPCQAEVVASHQKPYELLLQQDGKPGIVLGYYQPDMPNNLLSFILAGVSGAGLYARRRKA